MSRPIYFHHDLLLDGELKKLAKSNNSVSMREILTQNKGLDYISDLLEFENMRNISQEIVGIMRGKYGKKHEK